MDMVKPEEQCSECLYDLPLAYSYTPMQELDTVYDNEAALLRGTVFPELYKPVNVYGKEFVSCKREQDC